MNTLYYSIAALISTVVAYFLCVLLLGQDSVTRILFPMTTLCGFASALTACSVLQIFGYWPRYASVRKTGVSRGTLVVLVAHLLFGPFLNGYAAVISTDGADLSLGWLLVLVFSGLNISVMSLIALPLTLFFGCVAGVTLENRRQHIFHESK